MEGAKTNDTRPLIVFVHDGNAAYPAIPAYQKFFANRFECKVSTLDDYLKAPEPDRAILWYMMGFYTKRAPALAHIHDYRSLSVGRLPWLKDAIKKRFNFKPDLRIYQNEAISGYLGFADGVPECTIPVGISPSLFEVGNDSTKKHWDFAYLGAINADRRMDKVLDSFLARFGQSRRLLLIGPADQDILDRYRQFDNLVFLGKRDQSESYSLLRQSRVCVAYFPYHRPHCFQAPTKLLEYIHLGSSILANDAPSNLAALEQFEAEAVVTGPDIFKDCPEPEEFPTNQPILSSSLSWPNFLTESGIREMVESLATKRGRPV